MGDADDQYTAWDFEVAADDYDGLVAAASALYARYAEVLDAVAQRAGASPGQRILDIGTGTGNLALRCLDRGASVVGLDPSTRMLQKAREKVEGDHRADFRQVDQPFLQVPYRDGSFDAVVSTYAFHHIPPPRKPDSIAEMLRVIKPEGRWVLGDLAFESEPAERHALTCYAWLEDEYFARLDELRPVFAQHGLTLHSQQFTPVTWVLWTTKPRR